MAVLTLILLIAGFVLFLLAGLGIGYRQVSFIGLGLACWILTAVIAAFPGS